MERVYNPDAQATRELPSNVIQLRRALGYITTIESLPDNVYLLPKTPSIESEIA